MLGRLITNRNIMATKRYTQLKTDFPRIQGTRFGPEVAVYSYQYEGRNSTRDAKGNLVLRSNPLNWNHFSRVVNLPEIDNYRYSQAALIDLYYNVGKSPVSFRYLGNALDREFGESLYNRAYSSFRGKLYDGSSALGVTLGTYKESRQMIVDRFNSLNLHADEAAARIATARNKKKVLASLHLEIVFGWAPLLSDVHAVTTTVIGKDPLLGMATVKGVARSSHSDTPFSYTTTKVTNCKFSGSYEVEIGSRVRVSNPNLWLAERAGLLNPASVVWDLVPWSFVINMFMNTGQLVNSLTDFCGLTFENQYVQYKYRGRCTYKCGVTTVARIEKGKYRSVGTIPSPTFMLKMPNASMELAAIAGSLFTQKAAALGRLIKPIVKNW